MFGRCWLTGAHIDGNLRASLNEERTNEQCHLHEHIIDNVSKRSITPALHSNKSSTQIVCADRLLGFIDSASKDVELGDPIAVLQGDGNLLARALVEAGSCASGSWNL